MGFAYVTKSCEPGFFSILQNFFFGGKVQLEDEAFKELRIKACELGGDGVIIDDSIETSVSEMTHVHVWATVIKYSN